MGSKTGIAWTDATWNPVRGCSRVSEGCRNCYAERMAARFSWRNVTPEDAGVIQVGESVSEGPYHGFATASPPRWTGRVELVEKHIADPLRWGKPRRVFVNSMSDLFHESLPDEAIYRVFRVMANAPWHVFQVLTKRAGRMRALMPEIRSRLPDRLGHVWHGVSVEDQPTADERISLLLETPAAVRFVSAEPLLGPIDFDAFVTPCGCSVDVEHRRLDWVIVGGESGPGWRPMDPDWARAIRGQCAAAGVPFFGKQRAGPRSGMPLPTDLRVQEWPDA